MKFQWVTKQLCELGTESEIRDSEIWDIALKMAKVMGTVLFNEKVIRAQISSGGKLFQCLGFERDLVDAINIGLFRGKLSGKDSQEWRFGMSLDIWSDVVGMALDKGDIPTAGQRKNILGYVGAMGDRPMPEKAEICQFLFDVDCLMYQS
ncbi:unnamed protein product [Penicillium glandicola]